MTFQQARNRFSAYYSPDQLSPKALLFLYDERVNDTWESACLCQAGAPDNPARGVVLFDWQDRAEEFRDLRVELVHHSVGAVHDPDEVAQFFRTQMQRGAEYFYINPAPDDRPLKWAHKRSIVEFLNCLC